MDAGSVRGVAAPADEGGPVEREVLSVLGEALAGEEVAKATVAMRESLWPVLAIKEREHMRTGRRRRRSPSAGRA